MITIKKYNGQDKEAWDDFVRDSKNGTFLFYRNYMEYHSDRFTDFSLLFYRDGDLIALMPASAKEKMVSSHAGLTYGGIVTNQQMRVSIMLELFDALIAFLKAHGFKRLVYKAIPFIYHRLPAQEDLYALFIHRAKLIRRDVSSTISMSERVPLNKLRKSISKTRIADLSIERSYDFETYMRMVASLLKQKYNSAPTHTAREIEYLATQFPDNIKLFGAFRNHEMLAGIIIYETPLVAHAQYIAATDAGKEIGALHFVMDYLLNNEYARKKYFDFGTSMAPDGEHLNEGVLRYKESFGARAVVYDHYFCDLESNLYG